MLASSFPWNYPGQDHTPCSGHWLQTVCIDLLSYWSWNHKFSWNLYWPGFGKLRWLTGTSTCCLYHYLHQDDIFLHTACKIVWFLQTMHHLQHSVFYNNRASQFMLWQRKQYKAISLTVLIVKGFYLLFCSKYSSYAYWYFNTFPGNAPGSFKSFHCKEGCR